MLLCYWKSVARSSRAEITTISSRKKLQSRDMPHFLCNHRCMHGLTALLRVAALCLRRSITVASTDWLAVQWGRRSAPEGRSSCSRASLSSRINTDNRWGPSSRRSSSRRMTTRWAASKARSPRGRRVVEPRPDLILPVLPAARERAEHLLATLRAQATCPPLMPVLQAVDLHQWPDGLHPWATDFLVTPLREAEVRARVRQRLVWSRAPTRQSGNTHGDRNSGSGASGRRGIQPLWC